MTVCGDAPRAGVVGCGREWSGTHQAHCVGCHRHFSSDAAALLHHTASGCQDPARVRTKDGRPRLVERDTDYGPIWGYPPPADGATTPFSAVGGRFSRPDTGTAA